MLPVFPASRAGCGVLSLRTSIGLAPLPPLETSPSRHPSASGFTERASKFFRFSPGARQKV